MAAQCPGCGWSGAWSEAREANIQGKWQRCLCPRCGCYARHVSDRKLA